MNLYYYTIFSFFQKNNSNSPASMMRINCISAFNLMAIGVDIFMWFLVLGGLSMCFLLYYLPRDYLNMLGIYWYPFSIVVDKSNAFNDIELGKKITCLFKKKTYDKYIFSVENSTVSSTIVINNFNIPSL